MNLNQVAQFCMSRLKSKRDLVIICSGLKGEGKTTFSIQLSKEIHKLAEIPFSYEKNMIFSATAEKIIDKIVALPFYNVIIVDEAIATSYKREWQDEINIALNKAMGRMRKFYKVLIFNIPDFTFIDSDIRKAWCDIWVDIPVRGKAIILVKDKFKKKGDAWHLQFIDEQVDRYVKHNADIDGYVKALATLPRRMFIGEVFFHKLDDKEEEEYIKFFSEKEQLVKEMKEGRMTRKYRKWLYNAVWLLEDMGLKELDIAEAIRVRQQTINEWSQKRPNGTVLLTEKALNRWVATLNKKPFFHTIINNNSISTGAVASVRQEKPTERHISFTVGGTNDERGRQNT